MASDATTCPSCGARVSDDQDRCDLCGTPLSEDSDDRTEAEATPGPTPNSGDAPSSDAPTGGGDRPGKDPGAGGDASGREAGAPEGEADASDERGEGYDSSKPVAGGEEEDAGGSVYCNQCGWENPSGANFCSKCGSELQDVGAVAGEEPSGLPEGTRRVAADLPGGGEDESNEASTSNQEGDGTQAEEDEQQLMGQQLTMVVGVAVLVVIGLFFVTLWSQSQNWGSEASSDGTGNAPAQAQTSRGGDGGASGPMGGGASGAGGGEGVRGGTGSGIQAQDLRGLAEETAGEVPSSIEAKVDSLRARLDEVSGVRERRTKAQLVNLYVGAGQVGRAAVLQEEIARAAGDVGEWERAANLLYKWMQQLSSEQSRQQAFEVAGQAALAYEKVVAEQPDNLDARTRMGETYLLTNNPMKGIQAINRVLEDDSTFVPARFQKGLALLQINRLDQAVAEFETVKRYAEEGSGFHQQADRAIRIIKEQSGSAPSGSVRPNGAAPSGES